MKKMLPLLIILSIVFVACQSRPTTIDSASAGSIANPYQDTAGLAQFQAWKAQNELKSASAYPGNKSGTVTEVRKVVYYVPQRRSTYHTGNSNYNRSMVSESGYPAYSAPRRTWSKAAKGTAIGAGGGAIIGALVSKNNRLAGGIIGGLLGGAAGYGIGHHMDKVDGRY